MASVNAFTDVGRQRLGQLVRERLDELNLTANGAVDWISGQLDGPGLSRQALVSVLKASNEPTWHTLAVLAATVFKGRYSVFELAAIACDLEPKSASEDWQRLPWLVQQAPREIQIDTAIAALTMLTDQLLALKDSDQTSNTIRHLEPNINVTDDLL